QAKQVELLENYRGALLTAFTEVEVALSNLDTLAAQYQVQQQVVDISTELFRLAERRYREGADDLLSLLDAQQSLCNAEEALLSLAEQQLQGHVTLYRVARAGTYGGALEPRGVVLVPGGTTQRVALEPRGFPLPRILKYP